MRVAGNAYQNIQGPITIGAPTGGYQSSGSVNAVSLFINGVAVTAGVGAGGVASITGTANQVTATPSTGAVTVSLPQNVIVPTPASGVALTATGVSGANVYVANGGGTGVAFACASGAATTLNALSLQQAGQTSWTFFQAASSSNLSIFGGATILTWTASGGQQLGAPTGGDKGLGTLNATGLYVNGSPVYAGIPQNSQSANYTTVLSDANKHIYHPSADTTARTWTIDSNANVPYPIGTAITFDNDTSAGVITLAITTDTLVWLPSGATGSRTIAANGQATALKVTATRWHLSGVGIT